MTTSEPQADPRGDDSRQQRTIGQRIRDAVLGDPDETRQDGGYDEHRGLGHEGGGADVPGPRGEHGQHDVVPDPVRDDVAQEGHARVAGGDQDLVTGSYDPDRDSGYDPHAAGTAVGDHPDARTSAGSTADSSSGGSVIAGTEAFDDRAAGGHGAGGREGGLAGGGLAARGRDHDLRDHDVRDHDLRDHDVRDHDVRTGGHDYDPTGDTGYVDEHRAGLDATTGDRDADYDTGRVDRDAGTSEHPGGGMGGGGLGTAVAAGGAAAAGAATHHRHDDDHDGRFDDAGTRSAADTRGAADTAGSDAWSGTAATGGDTAATASGTDTSRTDTSGTGTSGTAAGSTSAGDVTAGAPAPGSGTTGGTATSGDPGADRRAAAVADASSGSDGPGHRERLVPTDRADDYSRRWDALKGDFVDEPRRAVAQADDLVGELLDEIQRLFADQRRELEQGFDHDQASTEDLRLALRRYRSFFDRLLSF